MKKTFFMLTLMCMVHLFASEKSEEQPAAYQAFQPNPKIQLILDKLATPIELDGQIEPIWQQQKTFGNFTEYVPSENRAPLVQTNGYLTYDNNNIYVAFVCQDSNMAALRASYSDRDQIYNDDYVGVCIDPNGDDQKNYQFYANPQGIQGDRLALANGLEEDDFDLVWQSEARIYETYWTVEMKIPFESLRFPDSEEQTWSVHFLRHYPRDNEYSYSWMPITEDNSNFMAQAGQLTFNLPKQGGQNRTLEFLPYTIATQHHFRNESPASSNFDQWEHDDIEKRAGFGVKYGLSSNMTLDVTYNPDFSQIESDGGQISVNNPFALFFDERRPFFQEGQEIYVVDMNTNGIILDQYINLFYSRSINNPLMAGKLSGKVGNWMIGYTTAYDQNTPYIVPMEERSAVLATNKNSYNNIMRAKYDLGNQSSVGFFVSDRRLKTNGANTVTAVDGTYRLSEKYKMAAIAAYSYTEEMNDTELSQSIGSETFEAGGEEKTAAFDGENFSGSLLRLKMQRDARHLDWALALEDFSPGFRSENGFVTTTGYRMGEATAQYSFRWDDHPLFTSISPRMNTWRKFNYDGIIKDTGVSTSTQFQFRQQTFIRLGGFIFNRENLRGKQFGDARQLWLTLFNNSWNNLNGWIYASVGKEINRFGNEKDVRNPFEIVPSVRYTLFLNVKPSTKINNDLQFQDFYLWQEFGDDQIVGQKILRDTFSYQFNKKLFIRLIAEFQIVKYHVASVPGMITEKSFTVDPLISYKLNPFSVFFVGAQLGSKTDFFLDWNDMRMANQDFYIKFQYLFRT